MSFKLNHGLFQLNITDYYAIIGISLRANGNEIRKRYLKIAQRLHPDTCKAKHDEEKNLANQLLSKLVNPAYEVLSKDKSRTEQLLIVNAIGQRLAEEGGKIPTHFASSKELLQAGIQFPYLYEKLLMQLALQQYQSLDDVIKKIEEISELNLVYSIIKANQELRRQQDQEVEKENIGGSKTVIQKISPATNNVNRAKQCMQNSNYIQAILELKEALKLDPDSATVYGLLGLVYLRQKQLGMAKTYINKAYQLDPKNPIVIESKNELSKVISHSPQSSNTKTTNSGKSSDSGGGGLFGGLFGGKKK
jgi:curved DNA-binding protein CbpA